jgi:NAD(P)-dependent dehydrogenase (short-subunit alcohol dehydrogenase family)
VKHREDANDAVFITGASTGIGAACVERLVGAGFTVFAGVRNASDGADITERFGDWVEPVVVDITDSSAVAMAAKRVAAVTGDAGCQGLVNNAGEVHPGPLEFQPLDEIRAQLEVNLFGHLAVTQAFLPLIRLGGGRVVNVGSIGGRLVLPLHGAYSASKFAMEAVSDALRLELRQWNIHVALVDPGVTDTAIFAKTLASMDAMHERLLASGSTAYDGQIEAVRRLLAKTAENPAPADKVAKAVEHALTSKNPKSRYLAGKGARSVAALARVMPDGIKDLLVARRADLYRPQG